MKLLSLLLVVLILASAFSKPPVVGMKTNAANNCTLKHKAAKPSCCPKSNSNKNNNKMHTDGSFCYYCVLCIAFIIPAKPGIQRNFVLSSVIYADLVQSKLTDFNSPPWRPPTA